jgi:hypothetical protein
MRFLSFLALLLPLSCASPQSLEQNGSKTAERFSAAFLVADNDTLRSQLSSDAVFIATGRNASLAALHVIRTCPQSQSKDGLLRRWVVLIGGGNNNAVYGIDVTVVNEGPQWKVKQAKMARDPEGSPLLFLRNCNTDMSGPRVNFGGNFPSNLTEPLTPGSLDDSLGL